MGGWKGKGLVEVEEAVEKADEPDVREGASEVWVGGLGVGMVGAAGGELVTLSVASLWAGATSGPCWVEVEASGGGLGVMARVTDGALMAGLALLPLLEVATFVPSSSFSPLCAWI